MPEMRVNFAEFPPHRRFPKRNANRQHKMSGMGHEQTSRHVRVMSGVPLKADIHQRGLHVRLVPKADMQWRCKLVGAVFGPCLLRHHRATEGLFESQDQVVLCLGSDIKPAVLIGEALCIN